jgi:NhaA family Na+:H+ antiporter
MTAFAIAGGLMLVLFGFNRMKWENPGPYFVVGLFLWYAVFQSGLHATIAGVLLATTIPLHGKDGHSPLHSLEHTLHPWVNFIILPIFGFTNAGVPLQGASFSMLLHPVALGTGLGLFLGKQIGIFGASWLAFKLKVAQLPTGANYQSFYGVCVLGGIGFTMSLFVSMLAFSSPELMTMARIGIVVGSLLSAGVGFWLVRRGLAANSALPAGGVALGAHGLASTAVTTIIMADDRHLDANTDQDGTTTNDHAAVPPVSVH